MKKFTINCDFGGQMAPFTIFIGEPESDHHPLHFQADWLSKERNGTIPSQVMDAIAKLKDLAIKNNVSLEELCVYALGSVGEAAVANSSDQSVDAEGDMQDAIVEGDAQELSTDNTELSDEPEAQDQSSDEENGVTKEEPNGVTSNPAEDLSAQVIQADNATIANIEAATEAEDVPATTAPSDEAQDVSTTTAFADEVQDVPTITALADEAQDVSTITALADEVQDVPTTTALADEAQDVSTVTALADEVQDVPTTTALADEVQDVPTTTAPSDESKMILTNTQAQEFSGQRQEGNLDAVDSENNQVDDNSPHQSIAPVVDENTLANPVNIVQDIPVQANMEDQAALKNQEEGLQTIDLQKQNDNEAEPEEEVPEPESEEANQQKE